MRSRASLPRWAASSASTSGRTRPTIVTDVLADRGAKAVQLIADVAQRPRLPESELTRVKANMVRDLAIQRSTPQSLAA